VIYLKQAHPNRVILPELMKLHPAIITVVVLCAGFLDVRAGAADPTGLELENRFTRTVHPFIETYCISCHGKDKPKGDLDLSPYTTAAGVASGFGNWEMVQTRLEAGEMPPAKAKDHPTAKQSGEIVAWIQALRKNEALKSAGDPGIVLARRLSNAEYDYTIHDLTGVDLRPTKEFPVDPANQAGFDNSGESLTMSPTLWKKYYQAARDVADTMVFEPDGFTFAPHPMLVETDRDKYSVLRIVGFYQRQPTDFADYFLAAWRFQHRAELGQPQATLADIAAQSKVSAKYLATVWAVLSDANEPVGPIAKLQSMWRALPTAADADPAALRAGTGRMRDWVLNLRDQLVPDVANLNGGLFRGGSQPAVLWKDRQMAANRRLYSPALLKTGQPPVVAEQIIADNNTIAAVPTATTAALGTSDLTTLASQKAPVAVVNPTPKMGQRLANGLGTPAAPVPTTAPDGRKLSAVEIADLALAAQPARKVGGPLPKTPDIVKYGGVFLEAQVVTTSSSVTAKMARALKRGSTVDPDLFVPENPAERARYEAAFARFADVFPDAFFISERARVYLDAETEASLEGRLLSAGLDRQAVYFRDDGPLYDMVLDDAGRRELDRLWEIFNFNAELPARNHLAFISDVGGSLRGTEFEQFRPENHEATSQAMIKSLTDLTMTKVEASNPGPVALAAVKDHFARTAAENLWLDQTRAAAVPGQLRDLQNFAERAFRRPLSAKEREDIVAFYNDSRKENGVNHEDAMRDAIVRILMSPYFLYRLDLNATGQVSPPVRTALAVPVSPKAGGAQSPVTLGAQTDSFPYGTRPLSDYELANRLSYFLWSTMPDAELLAHAATGDLQRPEVLLAQTRRMLKDPHVHNFATEFAGHWLDFRQFEQHNAVDRERFPSFDNDLREAMFEEPLQFFTDLVREDRSVLDCLYGDYTFVNAPLAKHYGIPGTFADDAWTRVGNAGQFERGGLLPMAVFLTANSPGLRTSPVKRGYWVVRRILGERIPPPPAVVPDLPADEKNLGELTLRQTLEKHRQNPVCASCHARFDAFGLVFEGFGAIGERRTQDFGDHPVDTRAEFPGGVNGSGLAGLRDYIRAHREGDFIDNLTSKLLAYGLGRTLLMSDDSLLAEMKTKLAADNYRFDSLIDTIVTSPQFRTRRVTDPAKTAMNN
jgi:mono/diheme cytochrome c family protein